MLSPQLVSILVYFLPDPFLADWANDHVELVAVTPDATPMIVRSPMLPTEDVPAVLALEGHEVSLMAFGQFTVFTDRRFEHFLFFG